MKNKLTKVSDFFMGWGLLAWMILTIFFLFFFEGTKFQTIIMSIVYLMMLFGGIVGIMVNNKRLEMTNRTIRCIIYSDAHFKPDKNGFKKILLDFPIELVPKENQIIRINNPYEPTEELILKTTRIEYVHQFGRLQTVIIKCL